MIPAPRPINQRSMQLATIRIHDREILSLDCPRIDAKSASELVELVAASLKRGARIIVLDLGPTTIIDSAGARAIETASRLVGRDGRLCLAGLSCRARSLLRAVRVSERVDLVEWWTDAVDPMAAAA
jgi:anti-anti-sigma regulatory factor